MNASRKLKFFNWILNVESLNELPDSKVLIALLMMLKFVIETFKYSSESKFNYTAS